jgi:hypothetical protein
VVGQVIPRIVSRFDSLNVSITSGEGFADGKLHPCGKRVEVQRQQKANALGVHLAHVAEIEHEFRRAVLDRIDRFPKGFACLSDHIASDVNRQKLRISC